MAHESKRHLIRIVPPIPGLWNCFVHADCVCNELVSACNRVVGDVIKPTVEGLRLLRRESKRLARKYPSGEERSLESVLNTFKGSRRAIYERAYQSLAVRPFGDADARIQSFVKAEKTNPLAKVNPDPRMIQARTPRYNLMIAKYLRYVEHLIYNLKHNGIRSVAKGMNQRVRAETILEKFSRFNDPICFSIDCSRWDQHVSDEVLEIEHGFYQHFYPNSEELRALLRHQRRNKCRTKNGVKYAVRGGRMSGDINTALGNCLLMVIMVRAAMGELDTKYDLLDDGDDCLIFIERSDFERVKEQLPAIFKAFGQELKIENIAERPSEVLFCQSRMVFNGKHHVMVRDWRKVLSQACCGTKHWNIPDMVRPMMGMVAACESVLNAGVPILAPFAAALHRMSRGRMAKLNACDSGLLRRYQIELGTDKTPTFLNSEISLEARLSFQETFGVMISEQRTIEKALAEWDIDSEIARTVPVELDNTWDPVYSDAAYIPAVY